MTQQTRCPVPHGARKTSRGDDASSPAVELIGNTWHVRGHDAVRQVLRSAEVTQAGFAAETIRRSQPRARRPVLYNDGAEHRDQRRKIARYFAPATVGKKYRELMEERADALVADIAARGRVDLRPVTMRYSVDVASQVVGLTNSDRDAMAKRLEAFFDSTGLPPIEDGGPSGRFGIIVSALRNVRMMAPLMRFNRQDVKPAIAARRAHPQQDVISHLIESGYSDEEILIECVTYGAAGMVTTREFISMATLHFLRTPPLRDRYLTAGEPERLAILGEILRLEPVVGHLFRRAQADLTVTDGDQTHTIPQGALIDLGTRQTNADERIVGAEPERICPGRDLPKGWSEEVMSFGDGPHKCPGNALALRESDVFLTRLLGHDLELVTEPHLEWDELIAGYALRGFEIAVR